MAFPENNRQSIDWILWNALRELEELASEGQVFRRIIQTDSVLQIRAASLLSSPEYASRQKIRVQVHKEVLQAVRRYDMADVAAKLGEILGELSVGKSVLNLSNTR